MAKETNQVGPSARVKLVIADVDLSVHCTYLEWSSFLNTGYLVKGEVEDANFYNLKSLTKGGGDDAKVEYLKKGRQKPVPVTFQFIWGPDNFTEERIAYLTALQGRGKGQKAMIEFVAIDPPSFLLNAGTADGRVYKGKISKVIEDVILDYTGKTEKVPNLKVNVTETRDNENNYWYMARQDPKTFILGLLDFSSSMSSDKSRWLISSNDKTINIKKESDLEGIHLGSFNVASIGDNGPRDADWWDLGMNNFISNYQAQLITSGISATSGQFLDPKNNKEEVVVKDENTKGKRNVDIKSDRGFTKPGRSDTWPQGLPATFIQAIPEPNARDIGMAYSEYIDGRARQKFINMLNMGMRIQIEIDGLKEASSSDLLGVSTCTLKWKDIGNEDELYFLHGNWIVYGFRHQFFDKIGRWKTSLYLSRLDHNAEAKKLNAPSEPG